VSIRNNITIICFTVPLCSCITSLGSEQPLLFYLLYSFIPTKTKQKKGNSYFFYTPPEVDSQIYCVILYFSYCHVKSHRWGEDFFEGRNLSRAMDVCVCLSGADGSVVEGRATLFRHHREVSRVRIPGRMGLPWMLCCVRFVSSRQRRGEERVAEGGRGWPEPRRTTKGKMENISRPQGT
jgi:hypothetical protein